MRNAKPSRRKTAGRQPSPASLLSYRAFPVKSTKNILAATFACAVALFCARAPLADSGESALAEHALADSHSLYLRESAASAIRWQPWNERTFALAQRLNRPMLIDIGASWCHWCHVMDQTTYADAQVATAINDSFVPVRVDSDERPDIDAYYQLAARAFDAGGWPLTCFTTPDGTPLFIAGYVPPAAPAGDAHGLGMRAILGRVRDAYARDPGFIRLGQQVASAIARGEMRPQVTKGTLDDLRGTITSSVTQSFKNEGAGGGARFYDFPATRFALAAGFFGNKELGDAALARLRAIAAGGVYDQLGGGFHRYSTDPQWRVPHFEKIAYDQAMALRAYAQAYQATGDEEFARILRGVIGYVNRRLRDPRTGAFYSYQDADAFKGDDGGYYTWTRDAVNRVLRGREAQAAVLYYGIENSPALAPNGRVVLRRAMSIGELAVRLHTSREQAASAIDAAREKLMRARSRRRIPAVDRAVLTDRNALMASGFFAAADALGRAEYRKMALDDLAYLDAHAKAPDGTFYHAVEDGKASVPGLVADQVYIAAALLDAYQATGDGTFLHQASALANLVFENFRDPKSGLLENHPSLTKGTALAHVAPQTGVFFDDPTPAVQAEAAGVFADLAGLTSDPAYAAKAEQLLKPAAGSLAGFGGSSNGTLGLQLELRVNGRAVVAITGAAGKSRSALMREAMRAYRPGKLVMLLGNASESAPEVMRAMIEAAKNRNAPLAFVCAGSACAKPTSDSKALAAAIRDFGVNRAAPLATK